jgi:DNA end-binding protein Ku
LHFQAEIRAFKDLGVESAQVSDAEMKLAEQLVDHLKARKFDPNEYLDEFRGRVQAAIKEKIEGHEISLSSAPVAAPTGDVTDLMAALRASLNANRTSGTGGIRERKAPRRATAQHSAMTKSARKSGG